MPEESRFQSDSENQIHQRIIKRCIASAGLSGSHPNKNLLGYLAPGSVARLLYFDLLYRHIVDVPGVILEFGVQYGAATSVLSNLRSVYEPYNRTRRIVGFDTFNGFPDVNPKDLGTTAWEVGDYQVPPGTSNQIRDNLHDMEALQGLRNCQFEIVEGDISVTFPKWLEDNRGLLIALVIIDVDLYEPTKTVLNHLVGRLAKGSVVAFDEVSDQDFPGETIALIETMQLGSVRLRRSGLQDSSAYFIVGE